MDIKTMLLFIFSAIQLIVCVGLFTIAHSNRRAKWLAISTIPTLFWTFFIGLFLSSNNSDASVIFATIYYVAAACLSPCYILMSFAFTNRKIPRSLAILSIASTAIISAMVITPGLFIRGVDVDTHTAFLSKIPYVLYVIFFTLSYLFAIQPIFRALVSSVKNKRKKSSGIGLFFASWLVMGITGTIFNLFLPLFGNYELIWVGPLGLIMLIPMAFKIATSDEYFSAAKTFLRGFLYCAVALIILCCAFLSLLLMGKVLDFTNITQFGQWSLGIIILLLLFIVVLLLCKLTRIAIVRLDSDGYDESDLLRALSQIAVEKHGLPELFRTVRHTLDQTFGVKFADIIIFGQDTTKHIVDNDGVEAAVARLTASRKRYGTIYREDVRNSDDRTALLAHDIEVVVPIIGAVDKKTIGAIVLSPRKRRFDRRYGETLTKVSAVLSPFVQSAVFYEQISDFNTELKQQVQEKTQKLRESNKELLKLDAMKDDLLSIASHNLRTPLTGITGYADMLKNGDFGKMKPGQETILNEIVKSGKRMAQIITDLLDATRIDSGRFTLKLEPINLTNIVKEEVANLKELATQHGRSLTLDTESGIKITGDESRLRQVVINLVDNAIYYGKSTVKISLTKNNNYAIFEVSDDGIGIPKEEQGKLFTKMFRASNAQTVRPDGSGIGLYVIKNIIESSGGQLFFESTEGEGSTFGFKIKL